MKKFLFLLPSLLLITFQGCWINSWVPTHELVEENTVLEQSYYGCFGAIKKDDGEDYYLRANTDGRFHHEVVIQNQSGKILTQINLPHQIRGIKILENPVTKDRWIFLSYNDQERTYLTSFSYDWQQALIRHNKEYESITRTDIYISDPLFEWYGTIVPEFIDDIDNDGRLELICKGADGFAADMRGLIVYDFDSGSIKWRYNLTTTLSTILFEDFDANGSKEFICGNYAFKNSVEEMNGMDDLNGWLMVISAQGELLYHEKAFQDYGSIYMTADDIDRDRKTEIIALYTTWGSVKQPNAANILSWDGQKLTYRHSYPLTGEYEQSQPETFYGKLGDSDFYRILVPAKNSPMVVLNEQLMPIKYKYGEAVKVICGIEDIDLNGSKEILVHTNSDNFIVLDKNLKKRAVIKNPIPNDSSVQARIISTGSGKPRKIAIYANNEAHYYSYSKISPHIFIYRSLISLAPIIGLILLGTVLLLTAVLRNRKSIYQLTVDNVKQGILTLGSKGNILSYNQYFLNLLKDDSGRLPTQKVKNLKTTMPELENMVSSFQGSKAKEFETMLQLGKDQQNHTVVMKKQNGLRTKTLVIMQSELADSISVKEKLAWAETAKRLAHNVRRYLQNAKLALNSLGQAVTGDNQKANFDIVNFAMEKVTAYTRAFQRFSELREMDLRILDVIPSVEHSLSKIQLPQNVKLIKDWDLKSVESQIEPIRFEEAVANLIYNSLEAMPEGGVLHISVRNYPHHQGPKGELSVLVEIEDSGHGIPQRYLEEIWHLFFTTKDSGNGVGLPETKKIIESMGGTIVIESHEGEGTVVSIWLKGGING